MMRQPMGRIERWANRLKRKRVMDDTSDAGDVHSAEEKKGGDHPAVGNVGAPFLGSNLESSACLVCSEHCLPRSFCSCSAVVCKACMERWFKANPSCPTCPACKQSLDPMDLTNALGMDKPPSIETKKVLQKPPHEEPCEDTLTDDWITTQADTKRCPSCHVWITREGGGVQVQCARCHHEFCWACRIPMSQCDTLHLDESFDDSDPMEALWRAFRTHSLV